MKDQLQFEFHQPQLGRRGTMGYGSDMRRSDAWDLTVENWETLGRDERNPELGFHMKEAFCL